MMNIKALNKLLSKDQLKSKTIQGSGKMRLTKNEKTIISLCRSLTISAHGVDIDESLGGWFFQDIWDVCTNEFSEEKLKGVIGSLVKKKILEIDYPDEYRVSAGSATTEYYFNNQSEWYEETCKKIDEAYKKQLATT